MLIRLPAVVLLQAPYADPPADVRPALRDLGSKEFPQPLGRVVGRRCSSPTRQDVRID